MTPRSASRAGALRVWPAVLALVALASGPGPAAASGVRLVRVPLAGGITAQRLVDAGLDVVSVRGGGCLLLATDADDAILASLGASWELMDPDPGATAARRTRTELAARPIPAGRPVRSAARPDGIVRTEVLPPFGSGSLGGFWTNAEVKMKLDDLVASDTRDLVADKVDTLGFTRRHRPVWALTLGKPWVGGPDPRPVVFMTALTHAREPEGMQALFWWVDDLLLRYPSDPVARELLEQRRIVICPVVNPDGYAINESLFVLTGTFAFWRKNARDNDSNNILTSNDGVDINRNYGFQWGLASGSNGSFSAEDYRGPSAFSEPETQIQRDAVIALEPVTGLSFHSYGDWHLHAWGYTPAATADSA
ncbi:MAG: M14 family zinc carboxypeptidase, partial [Candidatus Eisenbacteria bacterium]